MSILITIRQCEQDFTCNTLYMGGERRARKSFFGERKQLFCHGVVFDYSETLYNFLYDYSEINLGGNGTYSNDSEKFGKKTFPCPV